ncbi:MAG: hypothetical protein V1784_03090 [bacterium]
MKNALRRMGSAGVPSFTVVLMSGLLLVGCAASLSTVSDVNGYREQGNVTALVGVLASGRHPAEARIAAADALAKIGPPAIPQLIELYQALNPDNFAGRDEKFQARVNLGRCLIAYSLGKMGPAAESAVPALLVGLRLPEISTFDLTQHFNKKEGAAYIELFQSWGLFSMPETYSIISTYRPSISGVPQPVERYSHTIKAVKFLVGANAIINIKRNVDEIVMTLEAMGESEAIYEIGRNVDEIIMTLEAAGESEAVSALLELNLECVSIKELFPELFSGDANTSAYGEKRLSGVSVAPNPFHIDEMGGWAQGIRVQGIPRGGALIEIFKIFEIGDETIKERILFDVAEQGTWIWHGECIIGTMAGEGKYYLRVITGGLVLHKEFVIVQ